MIEIIREEDADGTIEKRGLPKDIRQIGAPDIGDRIYVEDGAYQFLHPYGSMEEKRAYVLLGKFENYAGRQCVFIEAAIRLEEMAFEGELPQWSDHTWAYIYKRLRYEYDSMVIVGWAMDIRGQLPNMTSRLENLHRHNFGGAHQVLFLMDGLEREEAFYGSRGEHLCRREGFYIYYEKSRKNALSNRLAEMKRDAEPEWLTEPANESEAEPEWEAGLRSKAEPGRLAESESESVWGAELTQKTEPEWGAGMTPKAEPEWGAGMTPKAEPEHMVEFLDAENGKKRGEAGWQETLTERFWAGRGTEHKGNYRRQMAEREERQAGGSYASTILLVTVVCALGVTAYLNHAKMAAMEATLAQMNQGQVLQTEQTEATETAATEDAGVTVETVAGNVQKQEDVQTGTTDGEAAETSVETGADVTAGIVGDAGTVEVAGTGTKLPPATDMAAVTAVGVAGAADTAGTAVATTGTVSTAGAAESTAVTSEAQTYLAQGYYVVQKGDSLVGICRKIYQTTAMMDKLCEVNGIEDRDSIYAGQYLKLPN